MNSQCYPRYLNVGLNPEAIENRSRVETDVVDDCHGWLGCSPIWTSIFDDFFQHLWPYIGNNTANVIFQMVKRLWLIRIDQMTLHSPTENSLAVLNHKILETNSA
ncbi:hypothetical protein TNCV_2861231 [Trichonephila clavipes]|nr:hypothetical protein TNCV_2861231 [Trichonephila clavipes]